jgi:cation diffusion facilitator family transporter
MNPGTRKKAVAWLSVISNTALVALKLIVGVLIGSVSVISEAIHSGVDLVAAVVALLAVRSSGKPADEEHPFGHGKYENVSGTFEAVLIFAAAGWIIYEAVRKIASPHAIDEPGLGVVIMAASAAANLGVSHLLFKVGRETDSIALQADGWHLRTDVWTSAGVMVGLAVIWLGDRFVPQLGDAWHLVDPLAALVVAALILRAAWHLTITSMRDLVDVSLPQEEAEIKTILQGFVPQLHGFHQLRTRKGGATIFIEFHIFVPSEMSVDASHRLAHEISRKIKEHFGGSSVTVHVEPCRGDCGHGCLAGCLLTEAERDEKRRTHQFGQGT